MWSRITKNISLSPSSIYIIISVLLIIVILVLLPEPANLIVSVTLFLSSISFLIFFHTIRKNDAVRVITIMKGIRSNTYTDPDDIVLTTELKDLENEIKLMFKKMKQDIEYLRKLERIRTEFLANVSHELRTPIFTIHGYLETLLDGALENNEVNRKFLQKANQNTIELSNLLNDLIDISMIESGGMSMSFRYFNINSFIDEIISEVNHLVKEKNLELVFTRGKEKLQLLGDKVRLKQVMLNLIVNAVKYTDSGKIEIAVVEETDYGRIIVKDTGIGIPAPEQERIFERFYRVDKARSRAAGGTGLGLAIVKHIIEAHGTKIELKSNVNEGSEFSFRLKN